MKQDKTISIAGNQTTTIDVLKELLDAGYDISHVINVGPEHAYKISDYVDLSDLSHKYDIPLLCPETYEMDDDESRSLFDDVSIDLLVSVGWQRLFPEWFLDQLTIGAFGMHGSADPLPKGRGRSPMNWSIIEGREQFITNLIKYDEQIDAGKIVGTQQFDIYPWDDIRSLHHKNATAQVQLLLEHLPDLLAGDAELTPQPEDDEPTYYPKRVPEDGVIDWREETDRLSRLIRAVTKPYPGAFTFSEQYEKIYIRKGQPFDSRIKFADREPGTIVATFHDGTFVVKTGDLSLYIREWEATDQWKPEKHQTFVSRENSSWDELDKMDR